MLTKTQIDKLGERLKEGGISDNDLKLLEEYRRSFIEAFEVVVVKVREVLRLDPTGRSLKSTTSIIDKLRRETIRLSQMQDIAGCRVTSRDIYDQDVYVSEISSLLEADGIAFIITDRRINPSHGYRAVHVVAHVMGRNIEIQVRTELQHVWAELCEALADDFGSELKYGGGNPELCDTLQMASSMVAQHELLETHLMRATLPLPQANDVNEIEEIAFMKEGVDRFRKALFDGLKEAVKKVRERQ